MNSGKIRVETDAEHPNVLVVTLDNPPVNALTTAMYREITEIFRSAGKAGERCVVLTAEGSRAFCAGSDKNEHIELSPGTAVSRSRMLRDCFGAIRDCEIPVIAAVGGPVLGGGIALVGSADVVVASDNAAFGVPEINVGVMGGTKHMARLVPEKVLRWLAFSGESLPAADLARLGGVVRLTTRDALLPEAMAMAGRIAAKGPSAVRLMKEILNLSELGDLASGYHIEQLGTAIMSGIPESKEAARAVRERRAPNFA
ncbi:enoyl-CoA hydratase-related protein [Dactylosporangium sp. CA-152071]|uniref:enoyl-CoA hydratase-related protein n=1 Tax=Dactylosporangium sp. CA-152071 TaxID=3239933 RepID=UPI003D8CE8DD